MPNKTLVDTSNALDLRLNHHLSYAQIAAIQGVTKQAIHQKIKALLPIPETQVFIDHRADILANIQLKLLSNLDETRLKKASAYQLVGSAGLLYDKERLERGQSTAHHAVSISLEEETRLREIAIMMSRQVILPSTL